MNKQEFEIRMKNHEQDFNLLMDKIKQDVISFADLNPQTTTYDLAITEHLVDNICESGAWIKDRIDNLLGSKKGLKYKVDYWDDYQNALV